MRILPVILGLAVLALRAQTASDLDRKLSEKVGTTLKESGAPSASIAVVRDGQLIFARAFGKASINPDRAAGPDTRYAVGSISKQFTAAAILLMQEQGKLSLDDPVAKYFPNITRANEITIRQLLSHTSGLEDYAPQDYIIPEWTKATTAQAILDRWATKPLNFDPGTRWQYSNTNYVLAGQIFEKASGQGLVAFLRERIFQPLQMQSAGDCADASPNDAAAYTRYAGGPPRPVQREANGWYFAAGELCMTPSDVARWDVAVLRKEILSARSYEEFTRPVNLKNGDSTNYALGLQVGAFNRIPTLSHTGEVSGFLSSNTIFPSRNGAVVVLTNEDGINLIGPISSQVSTLAFLPDEPSAEEKNTQQVRSILEGLRSGKVNRALFTDNANSYFSDIALRDYEASLKALGKLKSLTQANQTLRGGMIHRSYRAVYEKKTVSLNIYVLPNGRYEQFLVEE